MVKIGENDIGFIEEDSFDLGGQAGETTEVKASQVPGAPVLVIPKSNGTIKPTFDLIYIKYENMVKVMGGELVKTSVAKSGETVTGWKAPGALVQVTDKVVIYTFSGHKITIPNGTISAYLGDKLTLSGVAKIKTTITPVATQKNASAFLIENMSEEELQELDTQVAALSKAQPVSPQSDPEQADVSGIEEPETGLSDE